MTEIGVAEQVIAISHMTAELAEIAKTTIYRKETTNNMKIILVKEDSLHLIEEIENYLLKYVLTLRTANVL